jgi:hypothetical protein
VTHFIAVRLVLVHRISLQHCRPVDYVQEPNAEPASSRRNLLGETDMCSYCGLLIGSPRLEPLSSARARVPLVLCGLGVRLLPHRALGAPPRPGALGGVPVIPRKICPPGPVLPPPSEISRGGHGILPRDSGQQTAGSGRQDLMATPRNFGGGSTGPDQGPGFPGHNESEGATKCTAGRGRAQSPARRNPDPQTPTEHEAARERLAVEVSYSAKQ